MAAVEFALMLSLLLAVVALVAPLAYLFYERVQLGRASGDVIRFATSRSSVERRVTDTSGKTPVDVVIPANALPSLTAVRAEAAIAYTGRGQEGLSAVSLPLDDPNCPSGHRLTITLTTKVDVAPFVGLIVGGPTKTLDATATSCEE